MRTQASVCILLRKGKDATEPQFYHLVESFSNVCRIMIICILSMKGPPTWPLCNINTHKKNNKRIEWTCFFEALRRLNLATP